MAYWLRNLIMPLLSQFLGITVFMNYNDHAPPHFHATYGEFEVAVELNTGVVQGRFPRRALKALLEWYELHSEELEANWALAERHQPLVRIPPLE
jgi:hypothetical protein